MAHVGFVKSLAEVLRRALAEEQSAGAAREQMRGLAALTPPEQDSHLREAAKRFAGRLDRDLVEVLARTRGGAAAVDALLDTANPLAVSPPDEADLVLLAGRLQEEAVTRYGTAILARKDRKRWEALLVAARARNVVLANDLLHSGLRSPTAEIAGRTAWHLALLRAAEESPSATLLDGVSPPESTDPDVQFAFEVARRTPGEKFADDTAWIEALSDASRETLADSIGPGDPVLLLLSAAEREAVRNRWERRHPSEKKLPWDPRPPRKIPESSESLALRGVSDLPHAVGSDTIAVSGCRPNRDGFFGAAAVRYNVEGRPLRVTPMDVSVSKSCETAARNLVLLTLVPRSQLPIRQRPHILVALARNDCVGELDEAPVPPAGSPAEEPAIHRVGGDVDPPILEKRIEPAYPEAARRDRVQGVVILEAVISANGCVRGVSVIKGVDPRLDFESARAVSQWRYRPARLNGSPVRVYLTVTTTFSLRR